MKLAAAIITMMKNFFISTVYSIRPSNCQPWFHLNETDASGLGTAACVLAIALLLDPPQQNDGADKGDDDAGAERQQVREIECRRGVVEIYEPEGAAEMSEREEFGDPANAKRELLNRRESAGKHEDREQKKDGELDRLRLGARDGGNDQPEAEGTK